MGSIPLPALAANTQQPGPLDTYGKVLSLQGLLQGQKTNQLQQTGLEQENQQRALAIKDDQTMRELSPKFIKKDSEGNTIGYDNEGFFNAAAGAGVSRQKLTQMQMQQAQYTEVATKASAAQRDAELAKNKALYETLESIRGIKDATGRQAALQQAIPSLTKQGVDVSKIPQNAPLDDASLDHFEAGLGMHAQVLADAKTAAETNQANEKANLAKMEAAEKGSPLTKMENDPTMFAGDKLPASMAYLQDKVSDPDVAVAARATRLLSTAKVAQANQLAMEAAKKATDQAIADGDPNAAAKLLVEGTVAPSQLISSRKPEFAQKAFTAAAQLKQGWNAQKAEADFKVASSPANVAFFGSAKSLTDRGGTLDQLAEAAKDIPQGQIPFFNTVEDAMKAAGGSGPIAKYASILLGVSDDYSKVMGGGQGSDASRTQGLHLVPANASPEARKGAIEGIRGAVGSQINSRIGSNTVLQKMYGGDNEAPASKQAAPAAQIPANVTAALKDAGTGRHTLSDGSTWDKHADGTVVAVQAGKP